MDTDIEKPVAAYQILISDTNLIKLDIIDQSNEFRHDQDLPPMATELGFWFCEKYE